MGDKLPGDIKPDEYDWFCFLIYNCEINKIGGNNISASIFGACSISLPPIIMFGSKEIKDKVL